MTSKAVSIKLSLEEREALASLAEATNRSAHFHMRAAVQGYLADQTWRQSLLEEAEASWQHYAETGLHVTAEEMETWAADATQEPPACHD